VNKPNILWICTDQQRSDTIAALGNRFIRTPNLDRLVASGVAVENAYCQAPICTPSRASFMTGRYPGSIRASMNGNDRWAEAAPLVSNYLQDSGYRCGLVGKLHLAGFHGRVEPRPRDDGFEFFRISNDAGVPAENGNDYARWLETKGFPHTRLREDRSTVPPQLHQSAWCAETSVQFIEESDDRPWFLFMSFTDPHPVYEPPAEYKQKYQDSGVPEPLWRESDRETQRALRAVDFEYDRKELEDVRAARAGYYGMIELVDRSVGRMMDSLDQKGLRESTLVIFCSDHGDMMGDHGLIRKGCRFYEGLTHVPLIFSMPQTVGEGRRTPALVELTDILPTILEAGQIPIPESLHGRSLWSRLTGSAPLDGHRSLVRSEFYRAQMRPEYRGTYATMVRDERYKLVVYHGLGLGELYDLREDPGEFVNLWDSERHRDARFRLVVQSFDALATSVDLGPERTRPA
jgi:arylsulfatase A-like enzyme